MHGSNRLDIRSLAGALGGKLAGLAPPPGGQVFFPRRETGHTPHDHIRLQVPQCAPLLPLRQTDNGCTSWSGSIV